MGRPWQHAADAVAAWLCSSRFGQQFAALFYKNVLVAWRSRRATAIRLCAPAVFLLLALIVNAALNANNALQERFVATRTSQPQAIGPIPECGRDIYIAGRPCIDFVWTPSNDTRLAAVVASIMAHNVPPIPPQRVVGFASRAQADDYLLAHPDGALGALHFVPRSDRDVGFIVQSNSTVKYFKGTFQDPTTFFSLPMANAAARELVRAHIASAAAAAAASGDAAAVAAAAAGSLEWAPRLARFPHPSLQNTNLLGQVLSSFIFASLMFGFVSQATALVSEKDLGLRLALSHMGMLQSAYWASWMVFDALLTLATSALLVVFGMVLRFDYFTHNDFSLLLLLFWLFGVAMTSFSYLLSVLVRKTQGAVYLGFSVFIVGWVFQSVIFLAKLPYAPNYYYSATNPWGRVFFWVFALFPWNPLTKGVLDLNEATLAPGDPGLRWGQQWSYCSYQPDPALQAPYDPATEFRSYACVYPLWQVYLTLLVQWAAYLAAAVYLSNVLPNEVGSRRPWNYFLRLSYWCPRTVDAAAALQRVLQQEAEGLNQPPAGEQAPADPDVASEERRMRSLLLARTSVSAGIAAACAPPPGSTCHLPPRRYDSSSSLSSDGSSGIARQYAAELYGLRKVFNGPLLPRCRPAFMGPCFGGAGAAGGSSAPGSGAGSGAAAGFGSRDDRSRYWAMRGTWLGIEAGQLFCLLGPNGAGKTTTINVLTGVLAPTGGDALVYGTPLSSEGGLDAIRPIMGVCPQFDVLWGELTGREHLTIYGHIKGLAWNKVRSEAASLLGKVQLSHAAGLRSAGYSGGMKRRLSVAIALLGDPKIVYLDEPTTGMDPISRRHVWDIINAAKPGRAIVLTTHSMEEADVLGDVIAIMARGRLRALGSSIRLKHKFGSGYQLTVHVALPRSRSYGLLAAAEQRELAGRVEAVKDYFRRGLGVEPVDTSRSLLQYLVGREAEGRLVAFLAQLEADADALGVADLQCSLSSLEEVFLTIAKKAELEAAVLSGSSLVAVDLPDGSQLQVPLGQEAVPHPDGDERSYAIKWAQDDAGRLVVLSCTLMAEQAAAVSTRLDSSRQPSPRAGGGGSWQQPGGSSLGVASPGSGAADR